MEDIIKGGITDFIPFFNAFVEGENLIFSEEGDQTLTIDSGFNGGIAIPGEVLEEMELELVDYDTFRLATGEIVELPVFLGKVIIKDFEVEACFIPGDWLLGMEFLSAVGQELVLNFVEGTVKLTR